MQLIIISFLLIAYFGCQGTAIKGLPRPKAPTCLMDVENHDNFICGFDTDDEDFDFESKNILGTTPQGYLDLELYINNLENKVRSYQRRCRK